LAGNSNASASSKLGTTNSVPLRLITKNVARLVIDTAGRIAIGLNTPAARLHVNTSSTTPPLLLQVNGTTKLLAGTNGGLTIGSNFSAPANGIYVVGNVGIGTNTPASYKLHVVGNGLFTANLQISDGGAVVNNNTGSGIVASSNTAGNDGVRGSASGVSGWGVKAYSSQSYGIYSYTGNSGSYAGFFAGNVYTSGTYQPSARKLKQNITEMGSAMALVAKLQPKEYEYKQEGTYGLMNLPKGKRYGLIAEEVEEVLPGLVKATTFEKRMSERVDAAGNRKAVATEDIEFKAVNYTELIPIIVKGMQEQQAENQALKDRVAKLEELILELKNGRAGSVTVTSSYLEQNTPNPVSGITTIRYRVPETSTSAKLTLTNAKGQMVKTVSLNNRGAGQVNLSTSLFAPGTYHYTLYVDGKQADTKRLIISR
jgi:hypothetical protein